MNLTSFLILSVESIWAFVNETVCQSENRKNVDTGGVSGRPVKDMVESTLLRRCEGALFKEDWNSGTSCVL